MSTKPSEARSIAIGLAKHFLKTGQYSTSAGPVAPSLPAAAAATTEPSQGDKMADFGGLAVQAVGVEEGVKQPKIHIYLTRGTRLQIRALSDNFRGVPLRAHKIGAINVRPDAASRSTNRANVYERKGRVCCGSSCGPTSENSSGTLGAIVKKDKDNSLYLLSNNHVFAGCNHVPSEQPILAPSSHDGRPDAPAPAEIGRHHAIHELRSGDPYFVNACDADVAIARLSVPDRVSSWQGDDRNGYDTPRRSTQPFSNQAVKKFGRTTGLTFGEVEAVVPTPMPVSYASKNFKGLVWFRDVWTIRAVGAKHFALPGDSGSLVVTDDGKDAVGLLFAANPAGDYGFIVSMACIAEAFGGIKLVSGYGV